MVTCPFKNCSYQTNVYSSFNTHKSRTHAGSSDICDDLVSTEDESAPVVNTADFDGENPAQMRMSMRTHFLFLSLRVCVTPLS